MLAMVAFLANTFPHDEHPAVPLFPSLPIIPLLPFPSTASKTVGLSPCAYVNGSMYRHQSSGGSSSGRSSSSSSSISYTILGTVQAELSLLGLDARCFEASADMMHYAKTTTMLAAVHIEPPPPHPSVPMAFSTTSTSTTTTTSTSASASASTSAASLPPLRMTLYLNKTRAGTPGTNTTSIGDDSAARSYSESGFLFLQHMVQSAVIISELGRRGGTDMEVAIARTAQATVEVRQMPTDYYVENAGATILGYLLPVYLTLVFAIEVRVLLTRLLEEKEKKIKEGMLMVGLLDWVNWAAWFVTSGVKSVFISVVVGLVGKYAKVGIYATLHCTIPSW